MAVSMIWRIVVTSVLFLLGGCAPMYFPNKINTPLLGNQGEVQVGVFGATSGLDIQASFAATDQLGIMVNTSFLNEKADDAGNARKQNFGELGLGYLHRLGDKGRLEVFGGYGRASVQSAYNNGYFVDYADVDMNRIFIQPDVGFSGRVVEGALAMRFVIVNARQGNFSFTRSFLEPALTFKVGFPYVKFVTQAGLSLPLHSDNLVENQPVMLSFGLQGYINRK